MTRRGGVIGCPGVRFVIVTSYIFVCAALDSGIPVMLTTANIATIEAKARIPLFFDFIKTIIQKIYLKDLPSLCPNLFSTIFL